MVVSILDDKPIDRRKRKGDTTMSNLYEKSDKRTNMKVLVFGATGTTGREIVKRALELGYAVTAFVRDPAKVELRHRDLTVVQGDVLDSASVERAVRDHDAVLSSLGAGAKGMVRSKGTQNIVRAMDKAGIRRFVSQSTLGVGNSRGNLNAFWKYLMFGLLLRRAFADHVEQETHVKQSHLDWTIVRPGALTTGSRTGTYRHGFSGTDRTPTLKISPADVADFMLKQLNDDTYLRATPGLSY
jgi:putative NADH-flavin reductase